jgi:hypothetical protein
MALWVDWKSQKKDLERTLGTKFIRLMSDDELRREIMVNTNRTTYLPRRGQEEYMQKLRAEWDRRNRER